MATMVPFESDQSGGLAGDTGEESLIVLQSLICLMREKNLLSRTDVDELCRKVDRRARGESQVPLPCCQQSASTASGMMQRLAGYMGRRYGGKQPRH